MDAEPSVELVLVRLIAYLEARKRYTMGGGHSGHTAPMHEALSAVEELDAEALRRLLVQADEVAEATYHFVREGYTLCGLPGPEKPRNLGDSEVSVEFDHVCEVCQRLRARELLENPDA